MSASMNGNCNAITPEAKEQLPKNGISVIVVGSGIGGLSAARELWRIGCDVRVLERRPQEVTAGDRFLLGPSGIYTMRKFPRLMRDNNAIAQFPTMYVRKFDGTLIKTFPNRELLSDAARAELPPGAAPQETSRPLLYQAMLAQLRRVGVTVDHGYEVVSYFDSEDDGVGIVLKDGTRMTADLIIAADGLHSCSTKAVHGDRDVPVKPTGTSEFRASYPVEVAEGNELIQKAFPAEKAPMMCMYLAGIQDMQLLVFRSAHEIGWGALCYDEGVESEEAWDKTKSPERMLEFLAAHPELPPAMAELVRLTPPGKAFDYKISMRDPQKNWTSPSGRILQVGDAAHTYHPSSGNGATQAMEDAASLASCMVVSGFNVSWATRVSNFLRYERASCIQAFGLYSAACRGKVQNLVGFGRWIVLHDAEAYARDRYAEALAHLQTGASFKSTNTPPGMEYRSWTCDTILQQKERGERTVLDGDWS